MKSHRIKNGYSVCGGRSEDGVYAGVLVLDDDPGSHAELGDTFEERVQNCRHWGLKYVGRPRRIVLAVHGEDGWEETEAASAERVNGPVCPKEKVKTPLLVWTERDRHGWALKLRENGVTRTPLRQAGVLRCPQVAAAPDGTVLACERDTGPAETEILLLEPVGNQILRLPGRNPKIAAAGAALIVMTEQSTRNTISLRLSRVEGGKVTAETKIQCEDYTLNGDLVWTGEGQDAFIAAETCPAMGFGSPRGLHRTVRVWRWSDGSVTPVGEDEGALPVEHRALMSLGPENLPPIQPGIFMDRGQPVAVFRQFRYHGFKTFGWDLFWCRWDGSSWAEPSRLSPSLGVPDTGYAIVPLEDRYVCLTTGLENDGPSAPALEHRVEIFTFDPGHQLKRFEVPEDKQAPYVVPTGYKDIALPPPALDAPCPDRTLVWGDLHVHTTYSKCAAAIDGSPDEALRYLRGTLGCRVFTLADHSTMQSFSELTWCMDRLEALAGDGNVVLYGTEPGHNIGRHTNYYALDRAVFEQICRGLPGRGRDRLDAYRYLREEFPPGSVYALRHFHGHYGSDAEMVTSFEPRLEVAMEAMQGRCNAMIDPEGEAPFFPHPYLDAGCKVGIVGGTDHFRRGPNHYCLTGFWVKNISPEGVWEAIHNRFTFGMSDAKVALATHLDGQPMGSPVILGSPAEVRIQLSVSCGRNVLRATLIRDGEILPWVDVGAHSAVFELLDPAPAPGRHWYVPTVQVETAYDSDQSGFAHASPYFVTVEPGD